MCPPSRSQSTPKVKKINPFQGAASDPRTARAANALNIKNINTDEDMRNITQYIIQQDFETERNSETFREAEEALFREGSLTGVHKSAYGGGQLSKDQLNFQRKYEKENGKSGNDWKYAWGKENFKYEDQNDLQRIYDKQNEIETQRWNEESDQTLRDAEDRYRQDQRDLEKRNNKRLRKTTKRNRKDAKAAEKRQEQLMKEMMDQPVYQPKQAALPKVQAKLKTPKPVPVSPAPPPTMTISTAPAPELVNVGNPMNIVKQSSTSRSRARGRTKGTSSLT